MTLTISTTERDRLNAAQATVLMTGGHLDDSLCKVLLGSPFETPGSMCQHTATHRVERLDYGTGFETGGQFAPAVILTRVCRAHALAVRDEPGLIALTELPAPAAGWSSVDVDSKFAVGDELVHKDRPDLRARVVKILGEWAIEVEYIAGPADGARGFEHSDSWRIGGQG